MSLHVGSLEIEDDLDIDHELRFAVYDEGTFVGLDGIRKVRDHLNKILGDGQEKIEEFSIASNDNPIADALRDVAAAIRESHKAPESQSNVVNNAISKDRVFGEGQPLADDDPDEWNEAALSLAATQGRLVEFNYRKPKGIAELHDKIELRKNVLPMKVEETGYGYKMVLVREYDSEYQHAAYKVRTFRLDRIVGYVRIKT